MNNMFRPLQGRLTRIALRATARRAGDGGCPRQPDYPGPPGADVRLLAPLSMRPWHHHAGTAGRVSVEVEAEPDEQQFVVTDLTDARRVRFALPHTGLERRRLVRDQDASEGP